jgi:hypothetical protein
MRFLDFMLTLAIRRTPHIPSLALPPPMQDIEIEAEFSRLGTAIENHAQTFYAATALSIGRKTDAAQLARLLGPGAPYPDNEVAFLLANPHSRVAAARMLIAWTILSNIRHGSPAESTLLPPEVAGCMRAMTGNPPGMK